MGKRKLFSLNEDWPPLAIFFFLSIAYLGSALFSGVDILGSPFTDIKGEAHSKLNIYNTLSNFSILLWNPYMFGGTPHLAVPSVAFFYPFNLICMILPMPSSVNWIIMLHLFFSGTFTYYLLKNLSVNRFGSIVAGIVYMFSAPQIMHIYAGHLIAITSMPWTPLMLLFLNMLICCERYAYGVLLSLTIAVQFFAGYPQYLFYSLIALFFYALFLIINTRLVGRERWGRIFNKSLSIAIFIFLGVLLSAIQILPAMELTENSVRTNLTYDWVSVFSFPPENLITLLVPDFFGDILTVPYWGKNYLWEMTAYVGILPLLLASLSFLHPKKGTVLFFSFLMLLSIILAMGKYTPLLKLLYSYVPGFNLFRGNSKFIILTALSLSVMAGFGTEAVFRGCNYSNGSARRVVLIVVPSIILIALISMIMTLDNDWFWNAFKSAVASGDFYGNPGSFSQGFGTEAYLSFMDSAVRSMAFLISGALVLFLYSYRILSERFSMVVVITIILLDLLTFGTRYMASFDINKTYLDKDVIDFLRKDTAPSRIIAPFLDPNIGVSSRLELLGGYDNLMIKRYSEFINFSQGISPETPVLFVKVSNVNKMTDLLNAKYLVLPSGTGVDNASFKPLFNNGRYEIFQNINAMPRAFVVSKVKVLSDRNSIFREIASHEFNPATYAIIEEDGELLNGLNTKPVVSYPLPEFVEYSPNKVEIKASLSQPGLLVLGDIYYPGWKAYVDGKEAKVYKTNYVMRGVALPEGRHIVEFRYEPQSFRTGALISLVGLAFSISFLTFDWRKKRKAIP